MQTLAVPSKLLALRGRGSLKTTLIVVALAAIAALGAGAVLFSYQHLNRKQEELVALHRLSAESQELQLLVAGAQVTLRHWLLTGRAADRNAALRDGDRLAEQGRSLAGRLEPALLARTLPAIGARLEHELRIRGQIHALAEEEGIEPARAMLLGADGRTAAQQIMQAMDELDTEVEAEKAALDSALREGQAIGLLLIGGSSVAMLALLLTAIGMLARRHQAAALAGAAMDQRGREVTTLFRMGELLQSSLSPEDIRRVVAHTAQELLPELGGAFYVFNNSRDRLDLLACWGAAGGEAPVAREYFGPNDCWALKRGRPHACGLVGSLRCEHAAAGECGGYCVPMQARGEVYGVLQFRPQEDTMDLPRSELAQALADGVSLALANLALREKLRNQAMRDELTGLQNRRFLEEMLPRLVAHAERRSAPIAVLMLDLDHFKQINDRYGHAAGDAVLREVGALLLARLRRMDMACRYGGEELLVLMPDCTATDAMIRAQELCAQVRGLRDRSDSTLPPVTVSIGVAAWPEHGEQIGKVIEAADAALYAAKRGGRDRAMPAEATVRALTVAE